MTDIWYDICVISKTIHNYQLYPTNNSYRNPNRSKWKCHYCGKQGHKSNECYKRINDSEKNKSTKSFYSKRNTFCVALKENSSFKDKWIIDSGCTQHMSHNKDKFELFEFNLQCWCYKKSLRAWVLVMRSYKNLHCKCIVIILVW